MFQEEIFTRLDSLEESLQLEGYFPKVCLLFSCPEGLIIDGMTKGIVPCMAQNKLILQNRRGLDKVHPNRL